MTTVGGQGALVDRFRRARRDRQLAVVEGFHALKHALRFGAEIVAAISPDPAVVERLAHDLAPDIEGHLRRLIATVDPAAFAQVAPRAPQTGVVAIARRPQSTLGEGALGALLEQPAQAPVVILEQPRDMGNTGACIRVAAAAEAAGVIVTGRHDPWHADAIRGSAGLHFAVPVLWAQTIPDSDRPLVAMDPDGVPMRPGQLPPRSIIAFGSERQGLSQPLLSRATATLRIPMAPGVSSLNLATSVAAVLFATRLSAD